MKTNIGLHFLIDTYEAWDKEKEERGIRAYIKEQLKNNFTAPEGLIQRFWDSEVNVGKGLWGYGDVILHWVTIEIRGINDKTAGQLLHFIEVDREQLKEAFQIIKVEGSIEFPTFNIGKLEFLLYSDLPSDKERFFRFTIVDDILWAEGIVGAVAGAVESIERLAHFLRSESMLNENSPVYRGESKVLSKYHNKKEKEGSDD